MKPHYDLLIVGGGMVGASLASALLDFTADLQLSIGIVESNPLPSEPNVSYQPSYDSRSTALSYGTRKLYERMGVWGAVAQHASPIEHIHVSDKGHFGATRLHAADESVEALGYVVENRWLGQTLLGFINQHPNRHCVDFICPAKVNSVVAQAQTMLVDVEQNERKESISAELVVLADGGRSGLREKLGIGVQQKLYKQYAVVANVSPDRPHQHTAYERFTSSGPLALLPLEDQAGMARFGLVWTVSEDDIERVMALPDEDFLREVQRQIGYRIGRLVKVGERFSYPLKRLLAEEQVRPGLAVMGNAAHALHPMAGQGYNLALRGVVSLAQHVIDAKRAAKHLGDYQNLLHFHQQRGFDQRRAIMLSEQMMELFSNDHSLLSLGRDLGLQMLDVCHPAKTLFTRGAMGVDIAMPELR